MQDPVHETERTVREEQKPQPPAAGRKPTFEDFLGDQGTRIRPATLALMGATGLVKPVYHPRD